MSISTFRFTTTDLPQKEQFNAWREHHDGVVDLQKPDSDLAFHASMDAMQIGRTLVARTTWSDPTPTAKYRVNRTERQIRKDGLDFYYLGLPVSETVRDCGRGQVSYVSRDGLSLVDMALPSDDFWFPSNAICMAVPRNVIPRDLSSLHNQKLTGSLSGLLADYMCSLHARCAEMLPSESQGLAATTIDILRACLVPGKETLAGAQTELGALQIQRIKRYIDTHLFDPDLNVDQICRGVGTSRSALYRLFEPTAGVANVILGKRLRRAHAALSQQGTHKIRISDVARRHGFASEKNFSRAFKKEFGYAPRETQKSHLAHEKPKREDPMNQRSGTTLSDWVLDFLNLE